MRFTNTLIPFQLSSRDLDAAMRLVDGFFDGLPRGGFPAYDIVSRGNGFDLTLAVAGFSEAELAIEVENDLLTVSGRKEEKEEEGATFIHRGIARRSFKRSFRLSDAARVEGAELKDGILTVKIALQEPERKVQKIEIAQAA